MTRADLLDALSSPNVKALLAVIRHGLGTEGPWGYRSLDGGALFDDYQWHPRRRVPITAGGKTTLSSRAGAYRVTEKVWDGLADRYGFEDFSPLNQDLGAVAMIAMDHALPDIIGGHFGQAVDKCALEWRCLPGSPYGEAAMSMDQAREIYVGYGGFYSTPSSAQSAPLPTQKGAPMEAMKEPPKPLNEPLEATLRRELRLETYTALAAAIAAKVAAADRAGYARALGERSGTLKVAAALRGLARSWTGWFGAGLVALPDAINALHEALPMIRGDLVAVLGEPAAANFVRLIGLAVIALRFKTRSSLWEKGAPPAPAPEVAKAAA